MQTSAISPYTAICSNSKMVEGKIEAVPKARHEGTIFRIEIKIEI